MPHLTRVGKYEIEAFLGGGMSHVYKARDTVLGRRVALKVLTDEAAASREAKARFLQEARIASSLNHENIISIFDFGEDLEADGDEGDIVKLKPKLPRRPRPYMVMEYVEGESLREAIKHQRTGDLNARLQLALQVGRAIEYIHTRKIVHRDVKPENLHVDVAGKVRLMDFGVSKAAYDAAANDPNLKQDDEALDQAPGLAVGTPFYMAPEQVLGREPTPLTDVYAYGLMVYELLTGERPVPGKTVEEIFHHVLYESLRPEPFEAAEVPQTVRDLIARCTNKQLAQRPQGMHVVCRDLEQLLGGVVKQSFVEPSKPGLLSPSFQRPESTMRLKMPPPPTGLVDAIRTGERRAAIEQIPVKAAPVVPVSFGSGEAANWIASLRTPKSLMMMSACAGAALLVAGYAALRGMGWL